MARQTVLSSPLLLGFDQIEQVLDRITKSAGDTYPPYNIERLEAQEGGERIRIVVAVAGFSTAMLEISLQGSTLTIRGEQPEDPSRDFLHRGIAARRFERNFVLAEGMEPGDAVLENGLLSVYLNQLPLEQTIKKINITDRG
ncbi:MAG: Hsp20 family protein [Alphaproteobacteria bacterium]